MIGSTASFTHSLGWLGFLGLAVDAVEVVLPDVSLIGQHLVDACARPALPAPGDAALVQEIGDALAPHRCALVAVEIELEDAAHDRRLVGIDGQALLALALVAERR